MTKKEKVWGSIILVIVLLGYLLPYTVFRDVTTWNGSFLLWTVLAILIIVVNYFLSRHWGE